jgi:hypothetical protein
VWRSALKGRTEFWEQCLRFPSTACVMKQTEL